MATNLIQNIRARGQDGLSQKVGTVQKHIALHFFHLDRSHSPLVQTPQVHLADFREIVSHGV
jgi:hypothetical protein